MEATAIPDTIEIGVENSFDRASSQQKLGRPERAKVDLTIMHRFIADRGHASGAATDYAEQRRSAVALVVMGHLASHGSSSHGSSSPCGLFREGSMERCTLVDLWQPGMIS